jgi:hypothetical protein
MAESMDVLDKKDRITGVPTEDPWVTVRRKHIGVHLLTAIAVQRRRGAMKAQDAAVTGRSVIEKGVI